MPQLSTEPNIYGDHSESVYRNREAVYVDSDGEEVMESDIVLVEEDPTV